MDKDEKKTYGQILTWVNKAHEYLNTITSVVNELVPEFHKKLDEFQRNLQEYVDANDKPDEMSQADKLRKARVEEICTFYHVLSTSSLARKWIEMDDGEFNVLYAACKRVMEGRTDDDDDGGPVAAAV